MENYNLIFEDENVYGFFEDIAKLVENEAKQMLEDELIQETNEELQQILKSGDYESGIYKLEYNPMGAFILIPLNEIRD